MPLTWLIWLTLRVTQTNTKLLEASDCPEFRLAHLGSAVTYTNIGLLSTALNHGKADSLSYKILDYSVVCLSQGSGWEKYSMVSILVKYMIQGQQDTFKDQLHFQCINDDWSIRVFANAKFSRSKSPIKANFHTPMRRDCWACIDFNSPGLITRSDDEHCLACPDDCTGMKRCQLNRTCCNYFDLNGKCTLKCPEYSTPDDSFHCQCDTGFRNLNGSCVFIEDCEYDPCENDGECIPGDRINTCECLEDFKGPVCEHCNSTGCKDCFFDISENHTICTSCLDGYVHSYNDCISCDVISCKICSEVGVCSECLKSFSLDGGVCFKTAAQEVESRTVRSPETIFYPILGALAIILGTILHLQYSCQTKKSAKSS